MNCKMTPNEAPLSRSDITSRDAWTLQDVIEEWHLQYLQPRVFRPVPAYALLQLPRFNHCGHKHTAVIDDLAKVLLPTA